MWIYISCFTISSFLIYISENSKINKGIRKAFVFVAILFPILLSAFRADNIGTDVMVYLKPIYNAAITSNNLSEYMQTGWYSTWRNMYVRNYELGFTLLVYFVTKITHSLVWVKGTASAFIVIPVYVSLKRFSSDIKPIKVWIGMAAFYFMFYNISLNLMRQFIACSLCLLAYTCLFEKQRKKFFIWNGIALLFHNTAFIGLFMYLIYYFVVRIQESQVNRNRDYRVRFGRIIWSGYQLRSLVLLLCSVIFVFLMPTILVFIRVLTGNTWYLRGDFGLMPNQIFIRLPLLLPLIFLRKRFENNDRVFYLFMTAQYIELALSQLAGLSEQTVRITYYFSILHIIAIPYICATLQKGERLIQQVYYVVYLSVYWMYYFVSMGAAHTVPYMFCL